MCIYIYTGEAAANAAKNTAKKAGKSSGTPKGNCMYISLYKHIHICIGQLKFFTATVLLRNSYSFAPIYTYKLCSCVYLYECYNLFTKLCMCMYISK
jgi:hypothetical protein